MIARIVVESWTLWIGLLTIHGDGVGGEVDQLWLKAGPLDRSTYSPWVHGDGFVGEVDQLWVKAGPLVRPTYRPW